VGGEREIRENVQVSKGSEKPALVCFFQSVFQHILYVLYTRQVGPSIKEESFVKIVGENQERKEKTNQKKNATKSTTTE
jgi:hypothetical protein